jgi:hypothetical protein
MILIQYNEANRATKEHSPNIYNEYLITQIKYVTYSSSAETQPMSTFTKKKKLKQTVYQFGSPIRRMELLSIHKPMYKRRYFLPYFFSLSSQPSFANGE